MTFNLFTDLYHAIKEMLTDIKKVTEIPEKKRGKYRQVFSDTFMMMDSTLVMVILRLGDILQKEPDGKFFEEIELLDNLEGWCEVERKFRLCANLRSTMNEAEKLICKLTGSKSVKDWKELLILMQNTLNEESIIADKLSSNFSELSTNARNGSRSADEMRRDIEEIKEELKKERQQLVNNEQRLLDQII